MYHYNIECQIIHGCPIGNSWFCHGEEMCFVSWEFWFINRCTHISSFKQVYFKKRVRATQLSLPLSIRYKLANCLLNTVATKECFWGWSKLDGLYYNPLSNTNIMFCKYRVRQNEISSFEEPRKKGKYIDILSQFFLLISKYHLGFIMFEK